MTGFLSVDPSTRKGLHTLEAGKATLFSYVVPPTLLPSLANSNTAHDHRQLSGASIHSLPLELLVRIFRLYLIPLQHFSDEPPTWKYGSLRLKSNRYRRGLDGLMAVSRGWRSLIEGTPELWGYVESEDPEEAWKEALHQSHHTPLDLVLWSQSTGSHQPLLWIAVTEHMDRWRSVHIKPKSEYDLTVLEQKPTPALERFHIFQKSGPSTVLDLFGGCAPRLTSLYLRRIALKSWASPILVGLRSLTISEIFEEGYSPSLGDLVAVLVQCPKLDYLDLDDIHLTPSATPAKPLDTVVLPRLAELKLTSLMGSTVSDVLNLLQATNCSSYQFGFRGDREYPPWGDTPRPDNTPHMNHCLAYVTPRLTSSLADAHRVEITWTYSWIEVKTKTDDKDTRAITSSNSFHLVGTEFDPQKLLMEWVPKMLDSHRLAGGKPLPVVLRMEWASNGHTYRDGIALLKRLPGIDEIFFEGCHEGLDEIMEILSAPQNLGGVEENGKEEFEWVCPNLRKVKFEYSKILDAESLVRMVEARTSGRAMSGKDAPAQLEGVELNDGSFDKKIVEELRGALSEIALWK